MRLLTRSAVARALARLIKAPVSCLVDGLPGKTRGGVCDLMRGSLGGTTGTTL